MKKTVLSGRIVKSRAAFQEISLTDLNNKAGFGPNYIHRLWGKDTMQLSTINRIAGVLGCRVHDLLEEIDSYE